MMVNIFTASVSNIVNTVVGHPLDTIKLRIMTAKDPVDRQLFKVVSDTWTAEGTRGFFKGMVAPLWGTVPYNTAVFLVIE